MCCIPSGQIENILIVKSPAPEYPADFSGGFVKIATKSMPDENSIQISYGININTLTHFHDFKSAQGSPTDFLGFDNGFRGMRSIVPSQRLDNNDTELVTDVTKNGFNNNWLVNTTKSFADHSSYVCTGLSKKCISHKYYLILDFQRLSKTK